MRAWVEAIWHVLGDFWVWVAIALIAIAISLPDVSEAHWTSGAPHWHKNRQMSYYNPTGNNTSCGKPMTSRSWHVAALKPSMARCGLKVTICHRGRCERVRVQDHGAWRSDRRDFDATPRVKRALRCSDLCTIKWRKGWA